MKNRVTLKHYSLYQLKHDDEHFNLRAGDILIGYPYQYDPGKTTICFRIKDGFDPGCTQYNRNLRPLTQDETDRAMFGIRNG